MNKFKFPWRIEIRNEHSWDRRGRYVLVNSAGDRVAIISLNGAPKGDDTLAQETAELIVGLINIHCSALTEERK